MEYDTHITPHIVIGICTYKRKTLLVKLLKSFNHLKKPTNSTITLVLVNNYAPDHDQLEKLLQSINLPFTYKFVTEKNHGIPFARNRILKEAFLLKASEIVMTDDDCTVSKNWLVHLYQTYRKYQVQIVKGPVLYQLSEKSAKIVEYSFKSKTKTFKTGRRHLIPTSTNNILFSANALQQHNIIFDENLYDSGSSDTLFFKQLKKKGAKACWSQEALVYEYVPKFRLSVKWLFLHWFRCGGTETYIIRKQYGVSGGILCGILGGIMLLASIILLPFGFTVSFRKKICKEIMVSFGRIAGVTGYRYKEYLTKDYQKQNV